jgi:hypothetical protein
LNDFREQGCADARLALEAHTVFGDLAAAYPQSTAAIQSCLDYLRSHGVRTSIERVLETSE